MRWVFASTNPHKAREMAEIFAPLGIAITSLAQAGSQMAAPEEDADSFAGNARIKALAYAREVGLPCLADDSGLEVDALGGAPGVDSAHYAGREGNREERDRRNREKLLAELEARALREPRARLVCALCLASPSGEVLFEARGEVEGVLIDEARGGHGFGYDIHLLLPELGRTLAELEPMERNRISHRGRATAALVTWIRAHSEVR